MKLVLDETKADIDVAITGGVPEAVSRTHKSRTIEPGAAAHNTLTTIAIITMRIPVNATPDSGRTRHPIPVEGDTLTMACG